MSLAKVTRQLKRELKANPTKAAALGVLTVVAAVFWGPLLFKSDDKTTKPGTVAAGAAPGGATAGVAVVNPTAAAAKAAPAFDWRVLARGLASDPRMQSEQAWGPGANPFRAKTSEEENEEWFALLDELEQEKSPEAPRVEAAKPMTFEQCALELTSTIVGDRVRTAVINGKPLNVGGVIERFDGGAVVLAEVEPRRAIVKWNGKRRELKIPKPGETPPPPVKPVPTAAAAAALPTTGDADQNAGAGAARENTTAEK